MNRYTRSVETLRNNAIHRMIIVLHMHGLIACLLFFATPHAVQGQSLNDAQLELRIEKNALAAPFVGAKTITLTIYNASPKTMRLIIAEDYRRSIGIDVFDKTEVPLPIKKTSAEEAEPSAYKTVSIEPKNGHSFEIDLDDYVRIPIAGVYKVQARYYLNPQAETPKAFIASRAILIPITDFADNQALAPKTESNPEYEAQQTLQKYTPDEVVKHMLGALQAAQWERYFSLIDLHSLYINTTVSNESFGTLSTLEQQAELANFKQRIINNSKNVLDIAPPDHFSIEKTYYTRRNAEITTLLYKVLGSSTTIKRFVFYLQRMQNMWKVTDYNARLVGVIRTKEFEDNILGQTFNKPTTAKQSDYQHPPSSISERE